MGHALRYASLAALPPALRARLELRAAQQRRRADAPGMRQVAGRPRRDEEHQAQVALFARIRALAASDARFRVAAERTYAIPNGGGRSRGEAGRLKAEGVTRGVSDVFVSLPVLRDGLGAFSGLYIEMKTQTGRVSPEQDDWIAASRKLGYAAQVCRSAEAAFQVWYDYVTGGRSDADEDR